MEREVQVSLWRLESRLIQLQFNSVCSEEPTRRAVAHAVSEAEPGLLGRPWGAVSRRKRKDRGKGFCVREDSQPKQRRYSGK